MRQTVRQDLVDRVDALRQGRTWTEVAKEIGVTSQLLSKIRWRSGAVFSIEKYLQVEQWVKNEEGRLKGSEQQSA
jgi:transposase-like protein